MKSASIFDSETVNELLVIVLNRQVGISAPITENLPKFTPKT